MNNPITALSSTVFIRLVNEQELSLRTLSKSPVVLAPCYCIEHALFTQNTCRVIPEYINTELLEIGYTVYGMKCDQRFTLCCTPFQELLTIKKPPCFGESESNEFIWTQAKDLSIGARLASRAGYTVVNGLKWIAPQDRTVYHIFMDNGDNVVAQNNIILRTQKGQP